MNKLFYLFLISFVLLFSCEIPNEPNDTTIIPGASTLPKGYSDYEIGQTPNDIIKYRSNGYVIISSMSSTAQVFSYNDDNTFLTVINGTSETISTLSKSNTWSQNGHDTAGLVVEFSLGQGASPYKATIVGDILFTTAYLTNRLLINDLTSGRRITMVDIPNDGDYYSKPNGIVNYGNYILVACNFSKDGQYVPEYRDTGKVFVYDYVNGQSKGFIEVTGKNTNALYVKDDILYIISSGTYSNNGNIEKINLSTTNLSDPSNITTTPVLSGKNFMTLVINGNYAYIGIGGEAKIIRYNTSTWTSDKEINTYPNPGQYDWPYIPALTYSSTTNKIYAALSVYGVSMKLNVLDIDLNGIENSYTTGEDPAAILINE